MSLIILPHQLYDFKYIKPHLENLKQIVIWEHPHYFIKYNYNKKKLMLHRASMQYYYDYLNNKFKDKLNNKLKNRKIAMHYQSFKEQPSKKRASPIMMFDPIDKLKLPKKVNILESPNFLLTKNDYIQYQSKTTKFIFNNFYMFGKKLINVIPTVKSQDKYNRNPLPKTIKVPSLPKLSASNVKYVKEAAVYIDKNFPNNIGNTSNFIFPISHTACKSHLLNWIKHKFKLFGDYQDAINKDQSYLFHSLLSGAINIGLINPKDILDEIAKHKSKIPLNSYEGYVRQLFWREYQRYCYIYIDWAKLNYFGNRTRLSAKWYNGSLGIDPVDTCIKRGMDTAYLNHIERLMVIGNFMNLSGISPKDGFRWFMEFSFDSYEWVMTQNVLDMVFFVSGGITMRRPYVSSSNYIRKMSNYKKGDKSNNWSDEWDKLYQDFMKKHKAKLHKFRYYFPHLKYTST
jgi:deoxyribodipyrimidine photolyase-related protein